MSKYRAEIVIKRPPEVVFDYIADLNRHHEWAQHRLEIERVAGNPTAFSSAAHQFGQQTRNELKIVESRRPQRFEFEATGREGRFLHAFEVRPDVGGTRLAKSMEVLEVGYPAKLLLPLFAWIAPRNQRKDLHRIRKRLERIDVENL